jgi:hypothetical protein
MTEVPSASKMAAFEGMSRTMPDTMFAACSVPAAAVSSDTCTVAPARMGTTVSATTVPATTVPAANVSAAAVPAASVPAAASAGVCLKSEKGPYEEQRSDHASHGYQHSRCNVARLCTHGRCQLARKPSETKSF